MTIDDRVCDNGGFSGFPCLAHGQFLASSTALVRVPPSFVRSQSTFVFLATVPVSASHVAMCSDHLATGHRVLGQPRESQVCSLSYHITN